MDVRRAGLAAASRSPPPRAARRPSRGGTGLSAPSALRVLIWNLFHGRALPAAGRSLRAEFAAQVAAWEWDVALLQEVPPWWPPLIGAAARAEPRTALTSRNAGLAVRHALAERWPDALKSNGGGANALLARRAIVEYRTLRVRRWPERRVAQLARLASGECVVNVHLSTRPALAAHELQRTWRVAHAWAGGSPLVLGGDLNLRDPGPLVPDGLHAAARDVDHVFAAGLAPVADASRPAHEIRIDGAEHALSDHPPLLVTLARAD